MYNLNGPWDSGIKENQPMPTPQSLDQWVTLLGCIMAVYIAVRLPIKALYHTISWILVTLGDDDQQFDEQIDDPKS